MSPSAEPRPAGIRRFRTKLLVAMMLVVSALTSLSIYVAQRRAAADAQSDLQRDFELELASLHRLQDLRNAAVDDRSTALARNARIHAALEDNALDLLYPSAQEELRDLMERPDSGNEEAADALQARFYRFLDSHGAVIVPPTRDAGDLLPNEQAQLAQNGVPETMQTGYLARHDEADGPTIDEMTAVPIRSTETNEVIAALVLGFKPVEVIAHKGATGMKSGILLEGRLQLPAFDRAAEEQIAREVKRDVAADDGSIAWRRLRRATPLFSSGLSPLQLSTSTVVYRSPNAAASGNLRRNFSLPAASCCSAVSWSVISSRRLSAGQNCRRSENFAQRRRAEAG